MSAGRSAARTVVARVLGRDTPLEAAHVLVLFVVVVALHRVTDAAADYPRGGMDAPVLLVSAIRHAPVAWFLLAAVTAVGVVWRRQRLWIRWRDLDHGQALRLACAPFLAALVWIAALYPENYLAGRWHALDRLLVVALAVMSLCRPVFVLAFAVQVSVVLHQFSAAIGSQAGTNIDGLLVTLLLPVVAVVVLHAATAYRATAAVLLAWATILAAHFFVPGREKLALDWYSSDRIGNFPLSAYAAGWLGDGSGSWSRFLADSLESIAPVVRVGTLVVEIGAVLAVAHVVLTRVWLPLAVLFHAAVFAMTGFWLAPWALAEVVLFVVLVLPALRGWVVQNATMARGAFAVVFVALAGASAYQPPRLAWLDGPVAYGYALEAVGVSGRSYHVPLGVAAPFEEALAFLRLPLAPTPEATAAYGAVSTKEELAVLAGIESFDELEVYERSLGPSPASPGSWGEQFVVALLEHINRDGDGPWFLRSPPPHFWTGRPAPTYDHQEPLARLTVVRVTAIHGEERELVRREVVLTVAADRSGTARVVERG
jgi:hypothetical protein